MTHSVQNTGWLFDIRNLSCSYNKTSIVLEIENLTIPVNDVIFIVGPSGIGKSTLLETLGLMNNTIHNPEEAIVQFQAPGHDPMNLATIWANPDKTLAAIRTAHFSFIFQENNLMPGLTVGQNLCTKLLIQGKTLAESRTMAMPYMAKLDLPVELFDRRVHELSGGQRQRLAFLRAFLGESEVLFCDEPTGNLDAGTSSKLLEMLRTSVKAKSGSSAVIVSHDLGLASRFADIIVPIQPRGDGIEDARRGFITADNILARKNDQWRATSGELIQNIQMYLDQLYANKSARLSA